MVHWLKRNTKQNKSYAHKKEVPDSKKAILDYRLIKKLDRYVLLEIDLKTGRHHQIRAQLAAIDCSIKGDLKYGFDRSNPNGSIHLHASRLSFLHPVKKEMVEFVAPPPEIQFGTLVAKISIFRNTINTRTMIKRTLFLIGLILFASCGSYNSIDSFYEAHKNDDQVTAVRVPQFMLSLLSNVSPEMQSLIGNTRDLRYMQFPSATPARTEFLNKQMNGITGNSFIEVYRKNDDLKRNIVSIREKRNAVKEILIYNNNAARGSFLYFNGNFDPVKVREMAKSEEFQKLGDGLINQYNMGTPGIQKEDGEKEN